MRLLDQLREKIFNKFGIKTPEEKDEDERKALPQFTIEELRTAKYLLGDICVGGLATNCENKRIDNLWEVADSVEKFVLLSRMPNSSWFMDIETGEYYKLANTLIDNNVFCNIKYFANDFKYKNYYVVETLDLISVVIQDEFSKDSKLSREEIKLLLKNGWKYEFLKHDEKFNGFIQ